MRVALVGTLLLAGCGSLLGLDTVASPDVKCSSDATCVREGELGIEQGACDCGYCSYRDAACPATNRRWSPFGDPSIASACVPAIEQVDSTVYHTCVVMTDRTLWCWGFNTDGQLGTGQPVGVSATVPVRVPDIEDAIEVGTGSFHTCTLHGADGSVLCWGSNEFGQLGANLSVGAGAQSLAPVPVVTQDGTPLTGMTRLAIGFYYGCAASRDAMYCWGGNGRGQLGIGTLVDSPFAQPVGIPAGDIDDISAGGEHTCAIIDPNRDNMPATYCWGRHANGRVGNNIDDALQSPTPQRVLWESGSVVPIPALTKVAAGSRSTCAVKQPPGDFHCWGKNEDGRLGDGTMLDRDVAVRVLTSMGGENRRITVGEHHACGTVESSVLCWGDDIMGQLGNGDASTARSLIPSLVFDGDRQLDISAGFDHTCSLGLDRTLRCWGGNHQGQLGVGDMLPRTSPAVVEHNAFCAR